MQRPQRGDDTGAFAVVYGMLVVTIALVAGLVVDIGAMREDRRAEKLATDAASSAGALKLAPLAGVINARLACEDAWAYAVRNLPGASTTAPSPCASFPVSAPNPCPTADTTYGASTGGWQIDITWPVVDTSTLMTRPNVRPRAPGLTQTVVPSADVDGVDPCMRLAVSIGRTTRFGLAAAAGFTDGPTANSSVALSSLDGGEGQEVPLVVLDTTGCNVLTTGGANAVARVRNAGATPGRIAVDSDGSGGSGSNSCSTGSRKIEAINGASSADRLGASILAYNGSDGLSGILWNYYPAFTNNGGVTALPADLCPSGAVPNTSSGICPRPIRRSERVGRKFVDWAYHCRASYSDPMRSNPSPTCPYASSSPARPDYIEALRTSYRNLTATTAPAAGFTVLPDPAWTNPQRNDWCTDTDNTDVVRNRTWYNLPAPGTAGWYVNCPTFTVNNMTQFPAAGARTVVFRGNVDASGGCLLLNTTATDLASGTALCNTTAEVTATAPLIVYQQTGKFSRQNSSLIAPQVMLYQEQSGNTLSGADAVNACGDGDCVVDLGNGTGRTILWTAPRSGNFAKLALWSEGRDSSSQPFRMGAQTSAGFIGTFFAPNAQITFAGQPSYFASDAQFVAWRVEISGGALLELTPNPILTNLVQSAGVRLIR